MRKERFALVDGTASPLVLRSGFSINHQHSTINLMKKLLLLILLLIVIVTDARAVSVSEMTEATSVSGTDYIMAVVGGKSRKVKVSALPSGSGTGSGITSITGTSTSPGLTLTGSGGTVTLAESGTPYARHANVQTVLTSLDLADYALYSSVAVSNISGVNSLSVAATNQTWIISPGLTALFVSRADLNSVGEWNLVPTSEFGNSVFSNDSGYITGTSGTIAQTQVSGTAATLTGTETLANKTLPSPAISGTVTTGTSILTFTPTKSGSSSFAVTGTTAATSGTNAVFSVDTINGRIGMGVTAPVGRLHIAAGGFYMGTTTLQQGGFSIKQANSGLGYGISTEDTASTRVGGFYNNGSGLIFREGAVDTMFVASGKVNIGATTTPTATLTVTGSANISSTLTLSSTTIGVIALSGSQLKLIMTTGTYYSHDTAGNLTFSTTP